jgi:glutamate-1-semialdehyde 2,1-aminomutase
MQGDWTYGDTDDRIAEDLRLRLPERVLDAHAHLYRRASLQASPPGLLTTGPEVVTAQVWREHIGRQVGEGRLVGALFAGMPTAQAASLARENSFVLEQCETLPHSRGLVIISPDWSPATVAAYLDHPQFAGFKPYHTLSKETPTFDAALGAYLPQWAWELADERGLVILLHLVRSRALADPDNARELRERCLKHPRAKVLLAHAARGFHAPNTVQGLPALRGLENVWFDSSGICEATALAAILTEFGPRRLLWGSDFPVSEIRGRCVTLGDGFAWLQHDTVVWDQLIPPCEPILVGLESLRALAEATDDLGLNAADLQDIFADNALRLLGLKQQSRAVTQDLYRHAKQRLPGGTQLLSKRPEMMAPEQWPAYFREARGCETWDLDGRRYYDMSTNSVGACLLGFRDPEVTRAVRRRINLGSMSSLNPPEEVELADLLCEIHPWAEQVRFARCGGESCAMAARIARATTGRSLIAVCGYSGWHDWYLAANLGDSDALRGHLLPGLSPTGVPAELRGTTLTFRYNQREELQAILDAHGDRLAAVIMEPCRHADPDPGFLEFVRDGTHRVGALLVFDEISIGWRLHFGGAHLRLGVNPDVAIFAKALGNGHPIGAVIGTREAMAGAHESFISSTYWTEGVGPAAALATVRKLRQVEAPAHVARVGSQVQARWRGHADKHRLPVTVDGGYPCLARFAFDHELAPELRTFYTQLMLERGFLAGTSIYPTLAHTDEIVGRYGEAIDEVFAEIAAALTTGDVKARLKGPVAHSGFSRLVD